MSDISILIIIPWIHGRLSREVEVRGWSEASSIFRFIGGDIVK
jgi:hypothetical protein